jgi:hypothetical protein
VRIDPVAGTAAVGFRYENRRVVAHETRPKPGPGAFPSPEIDPWLDPAAPEVDVWLTEPADASGRIGEMRFRPSGARGQFGWAEIDEFMFVGVGVQAHRTFHIQWTPSFA